MPGGTTFGIDIPLALAALLPAKATNADRIGLVPWGSDLEELLMAGMNDSLQRLSVDAVAAPVLRELDARYRMDELFFLANHDPGNSTLIATLHE